MAYFEQGSEAMLQLEKFVQDVGIRNVVYALENIARRKSHAVADMGEGKQWGFAATKLKIAAQYLPSGID